MEITPPSSFNFLFHKWQLKLLAILGAIIIWLSVNQTITSTKTLVKVPVRLVNVPPERSVEGMLPNGVLKKRVALTLTGAKDVVEALEDSDVEVVIDVSQLPDQSIVQANKKNLVSLDPRLDIRYINQVESSDLAIQFNKLVTQEIPVVMAPPIGTPPGGYHFLDIWPQVFYQTVTASEKDMHDLKEKGLRFAIDLSRVTKADLDALPGSSEAFRGDEVIFPVPYDWKRIHIPCKDSEEVMLNDSAQKEMVIRFLRQELVPLKVAVPLEVYYPVIHQNQVNPERIPLVAEGPSFSHVNGMTIFSAPLLAGNVSRWFVDVVRDRMTLVIVADISKREKESLPWSIEIANLAQLEDEFVLFLLNDAQTGHTEAGHKELAGHKDRELSGLAGDLKKRENRLRRRFRQYVRSIQLYHENGKPLQLDARFIQDGRGKIIVRDVSE